jgi:hypothetical protein
MSKAINILLTLLIIPTAVLALLVGFDLNALGFIQGEETPYIGTFFIGMAIFTGILLFWLAFRRWSALFIFKNKSQFLWVGSSTTTHINRVRFYLLLEILFYTFIGLYFLWISPFTIFIAGVFFMSALEKLLFIFLRCNPNHMKAGIIKNGLVIADRDLSFFYFSGLVSVSTLNDSIFLEYRNELCLSFPIHAISQNDRTAFMDVFLKSVDKKRVFVSDKIRGLK